MISYTIEDIKTALNALHLRQNDTILIHSALQNFGKLEGEEFKNIPKIWRDLLLTHCANSSLIIPTFNYSFPKTHFCDLREQKSEIGILSETFREIASLQSTHPMFNFCGFGTGAEDIIQPKAIEYNPFLQESVFARLHARDSLMLFLGIDIRVCTFMVYIEAMNGVKYRFFKPFLGEIITHLGDKVSGEFYHFCLPQSEKVKVDFQKVQKAALSAGILRFAPLKSSGIYVFRAIEFFDFIKQRIANEPFVLLKNPPKHYYIFENNQEIAQEKANNLH